MVRSLFLLKNHFIGLSLTRGGFLLIPHTIEFYQGQTNRLSDRILFRRVPSESDQNTPHDPTVTHQGTNGWVFERLSP